MTPHLTNNGADPFVLLDLPRRPVINLDLLEKNFRCLAAKHHPDQARGDVSTFQIIQEAANLLRQPNARLRYLAGEETVTKSISAAAEELFQSIGSALQNATDVNTKYHEASGALLKALLIKDLLEARTKLITAQKSLHIWQHSLNQELQAIDLRWPNVNTKELLSLATNFTFVTRWEKQLREQIMELKILIG